MNEYVKENPDCYENILSKAMALCSDAVLDEESKKEMIRVLAIERDLLPDTDRHVSNLDEYFKNLGI